MDCAALLGLARCSWKWTIAGTVFFHTGYPFTVIDSADWGILSTYNYNANALDGGVLFANYSGGSFSCGSGATTTPCFGSSQFTPAPASFGTQRRNQIYGPNFFDTDLTVMKNFKIPHWESATFSAGAQFFNLSNHPNFDQPVDVVASPQLGSIIRSVSVPTGIPGSFLGGDAAPRMIQIKAHLTF